MPFLPDSYKVPESEGKYMKLKIGTNRFRVLSSAIVGYEGWTLDNKPVRKHTEQAFAGLDLKRTEGRNPIKHFWAFFVWNTASKLVQVLELPQKSIQEHIQALVKNEDWGDPKQYDIVIERVGEGFETEYTVNPIPPKPLPEDAQTAWAQVQDKVNLDALFTGGDPFGEEPVSATTGVAFGTVASPREKMKSGGFSPKPTSMDEVDIDHINID